MAAPRDCRQHCPDVHVFLVDPIVSRYNTKRVLFKKIQWLHTFFLFQRPEESLWRPFIDRIEVEEGEEVRSSVTASLWSKPDCVPHWIDTFVLQQLLIVYYIEIRIGDPQISFSL